MKSYSHDELQHIVNNLDPDLIPYLQHIPASLLAKKRGSRKSTTSSTTSETSVSSSTGTNSQTGSGSSSDTSDSTAAVNATGWIRGNGRIAATTAASSDSITFAESQETLFVSSDIGEETILLTLPPIRTKKGERVKLESMATILSIFNEAAKPVEMRFIYIIRRTTDSNSVDIATSSVLRYFHPPQNIVTVNPSLSWVDTPGAGTHVYSIVLFTVAVSNTTPSAITRSLSATIFP